MSDLEKALRQVETFQEQKFQDLGLPIPGGTEIKWEAPNSPSNDDTGSVRTDEIAGSISLAHGGAFPRSKYDNPAIIAILRSYVDRVQRRYTNQESIRPFILALSPLTTPNAMCSRSHGYNIIVFQRGYINFMQIVSQAMGMLHSTIIANGALNFNHSELNKEITFLDIVEAALFEAVVTISTQGNSSELVLAEIRKHFDFEWRPLCDVMLDERRAEALFDSLMCFVTAHELGHFIDDDSEGQKSSFGLPSLQPLVRSYASEFLADSYAFDAVTSQNESEYSLATAFLGTMLFFDSMILLERCVHAHLYGELLDGDTPESPTHPALTKRRAHMEDEFHIHKSKHPSFEKIIDIRNIMGGTIELFWNKWKHAFIDLNSNGRSTWLAPEYSNRKKFDLNGNTVVFRRGNRQY